MYSYVFVYKKFLNHTLAAIAHRETIVEGSLCSLHTNAPAVEAIGSYFMHLTIQQTSLLFYHLGLEATPIIIQSIASS